jgi:hypothetical protein
MTEGHLWIAATGTGSKYAVVGKLNGKARRFFCRYKEAVEAADQSRKSFLQGANKASDQNIVGAVLQMFYTDIPKEQHPVGLYERFVIAMVH